MILLKNAPDLEYFIYFSSFVLFSINWDKKNQGCGGDCPGHGNHIWLNIPVESEQGGLRFPIPLSPGRIQETNLSQATTKAFCSCSRHFLFYQLVTLNHCWVSPFGAGWGGSLHATTKAVHLLSPVGPFSSLWSKSGVGNLWPMDPIGPLPVIVVLYE